MADHDVAQRAILRRGRLRNPHQAGEHLTRVDAGARARMVQKQAVNTDEIAASHYWHRAMPAASRSVASTLAALASQVYRRAWAGPRAERSRRSAASSSARSSARSRPAASWGSTSSAALPTTSGNEEVLEHTTTAPQARASRGGRPKPS